MAVSEIKRKGFDTKKEAQAWAKKEKAKSNQLDKIKWEVQRGKGGQEFRWQAVLFKEIK